MSVLDRINQMVEEENKQEKEMVQEASAGTGKFLTPLFLALSIVSILVLTLILVSLSFNLSYGFNCWLDSNMITVTIITGIILVLTAIISFVSIFKEFKVAKIILIVISLVGIFLAFCPFIFPLLY
jgi:hypothetical protein